MPKKKLTRERLQQIIREEKQRLRRISKETDSGSQLNENTVQLNENDNIGTSGGHLDDTGNYGGGGNFTRMKELAGVNEEPEQKKVAMKDTLEMLDEVREKVSDRNVVEQLAKAIDDETFQNALREIAEEQNIQLY